MEILRNVIDELTNELSHQYLEQEKENEESLRVIETMEVLIDKLCEIGYKWK